jgi:hypothetical protein
MTLDDHLRAEALTYSEFARKVSARMGRTVTARTIERYAKGQRTPRGPYMDAVLGEASGKVDANSFYGLTTA